MSNTKNPFKASSAIIGPQSQRGQEDNLRLRNNSFAAKSHEMTSQNLACINLCRLFEFTESSRSPKVVARATVGLGRLLLPKDTDGREHVLEPAVS